MSTYRILQKAFEELYVAKQTVERLTWDRHKAMKENAKLLEEIGIFKKSNREQALQIRAMDKAMNDNRSGSAALAARHAAASVASASQPNAFIASGTTDTGN